jgi:hypothetical protein
VPPTSPCTIINKRGAYELHETEGGETAASSCGYSERGGAGKELCGWLDRARNEAGCCVSYINMIDSYSFISYILFRANVSYFVLIHTT